jgi:MFS family permease
MQLLKDRSVRNVALLGMCQMLGMIGMSINMTVTALAGKSLTADPSLATLPLALQFAGSMLATMPASQLMRRFGRRNGFFLGVTLGVSGALLAMAMVFQRSFVGLCLASMLVGTFQGFALFYRHAAADTASPEFRSKAISLVLAGGVVSAVLGPQLSKWSFDMFAPVLFAGAYLVMAIAQACSFLFLPFVEIPRIKAADSRDTGRPLAEIARQPAFIVALAGGMVGYGVMAFVMTATPLAMIGCGFQFQDAAFIIQWHALGMFAPSFFTGSLIARFGVLQVMLAGAVALMASVAVDVSGLGIEQFFIGLVLLGIGWNFLFVGATTLLAECHDAREKAKVQGFNDFMVFSSVTAASFGSGYLLNRFDWAAVNLGVLPLIAIVVVLLIWLMMRPREATA